MSSRVHAAAALLLLAACSGPYDSAEPIAARRDAVLSGAPSTDAAVAALVFRRTACDGSPPTAVCSGVLVTPRAVLTAAHCVAAQARGRWEVFFGSQPGAPDGVYRAIVAHLVHPQYDPERDDHDLALLWLDAPVDLAPAPLVRDRLSPPTLGQSARVVGFGETDDAGAAPGERREGTVTITAVTAETIAYGPAPAMTCRGDSGGPVLIDRGGSEVLVALTTSGDARCETTGAAVRLDAHLADFLTPALAEGPPAAPPVIALDRVCGASCAGDQDCPLDLVCRADTDGASRCSLPDRAAASFDSPCRSDAECGGGRCLSMGDGCLCERPCAAVHPAVSTDESSPPRSSGCQLAARSSSPPWALGFPVLAALGLRRHRRIRKCLGPPTVQREALIAQLRLSSAAQFELPGWRHVLETSIAQAGTRAALQRQTETPERRSLIVQNHKNPSSTTDEPANVFGTLTTLVQRTKPDEPSFVRFQLLVLEASGLAVYPLPETGTMSIGRAEECDVRLRDAAASRRHALLHLQPLMIQDRGSANGTLIGNRQLDPGSSAPIQIGQPIAIGGALLIVRQADAEHSGNPKPGAGPAAPPSSGGDGESVVVRDAAMTALHTLVERIAGGPINVLVLGETGVGKDVIAEAIHRKSSRREAALVRINCAALSETLLESELFGHERGAFTGAVSAKPGLIEVGHGGTVFLDEVGELSATLQAKLLRVIEARELTRVGGLRTRPVDVRFIAATNRDLQRSVVEGTFRADLFFRLNGASILIPPLRHRVSEIIPLAEMFLVRTAASLRQSAPPRLSQGARELLLRHTWPGNIRELRNVIQRAACLCSDGQITGEDLAISELSVLPDMPRSPGALTPPPPEPNTETGHNGASRSNPGSPSEADERARIIHALAVCHGNQTRAAKLLSMPRRTFVAKLPRYSIPRPRKTDPC